MPVDLIEFKDNQPTLDLLEKKGDGVFSMIDEEINVPKGTDETLVKKLHLKHGKNPNFAAPKPKDLNANLVFIIIHYAGPVPYNVTAFLEKNKDALHEDITDCIESSTDSLIKILLGFSLDDATTIHVEKKGDSSSGAAKKKQPTLGFQFKQSLDGLLVAMHKCEPHFVRCMKSNHQKKGNIFEADMMMAQLRYCGLLEVARIRKIGFPVRRKFDEFLFRYRCLDLLNAKDHKMLCDALSKKDAPVPPGAKEGSAGKLLEPRQWVIGNTKMFMRNMQQTKLEEAREEALKTVVVKMQTPARGFLARLHYKRYKAILAEIKSAVKVRTKAVLEPALAPVHELPYGGKHLKLVEEARRLLDRIEEEERVTKMCVEAVKARDLAELKSACKAAEEMSPPFVHPAVTEAIALRDLMEKEREAIKKLKTAITERSLENLVAAIEAGTPFGAFVTDTDTYKEAGVLKERLEQEAVAKKALSKAIKSKKLEALQAALQQCADLGLEDDQVKEGLALKETLEEQQKMLDELAEAIKERTAEALAAALKRCRKVNVPDDHPLVVEAAGIETKLKDEKEIEEELAAAADSKDEARIEKALKKSRKMEMPETPGVKKANKALEGIKAEAEALTALKAATKGGKPAPLLAALAKAGELGLEGPIVDAAKEAISKLGAATEALGRLDAAVNACDIPAIEAGIAECEGHGMGDEETVVTARDAKKRINKQNKAAAALEAAIDARERGPVVDGIAKAEELGCGKRFEELIARGAALIVLLDLEESLIKEFKKLGERDDEEGLDAAEARAKAADCSPAVFKACDKARAVIDGRKDFISRLNDALEADEKDKDLIAALLEEAKERGIANAKTEQANNVLNREKQLKETKKALKKAIKAGDERALAEAIKAATEMGHGGEDVAKAKEMQARLGEEKELSSGVRAALKAVMVKAEGKNGVTAKDLQPLLDAMEDAKEQGLSEDSPFYQQAATAKDRIEHVLVVQADVAKALECVPGGDEGG